MYLEKRNNIFEMTLAVLMDCERLLVCADRRLAMEALAEALKAQETCDMDRAVKAHEKLVECYRKKDQRIGYAGVFRA
jgi:hypothetical protein